MTEQDLSYLRFLLARGHVISGPVLELGAGYGGTTSASIIRDAGLHYEATDLTPSPGVTYVANFENGDGVETIRSAQRYGTVLVLNVLEHTFDPISVADNAVSLLREGGTLVAITPVVWPIHHYPIDCHRLLPDWYRRYASTRGLELDADLFHYVQYGPVGSFLEGDGHERLPLPAEGRKFHRMWSRGIQKIFNTYGRGMTNESHIAIGCVLRKAGNSGTDTRS